MTERLFNFDELDVRQDLKRRGPVGPFWKHSRLRKQSRVAINGTQEKPKVSVILKSIRDMINAEQRIVAGTDPETLIKSLGTTACQFGRIDAESYTGSLRKN